MNEFHSKLEMILNPGSVRTEELMSRHTTFRIGGPADYYVAPKTKEELAAVTALCRQEKIPFYVQGNGSNLLVSDDGYRGVMIAIGEGLDDCIIEQELVTAGAGILLGRLAKRIAEASLTGFEFAAGIPGSLGGALAMNAGAYGSEMKDVLVSATVMDREGRVFSIPAGDLELGYRTSIIPQREYVVLAGTFRLTPGDKEAVYAKMEELAVLRKTKQPLEYPSAGSTFKRPTGCFAGKLIEDAGLRGFQLGGAQVSEKHCGFVINKEQATAADVVELCREVSRQVKINSGVELELEVKILGEI